MNRSTSEAAVIRQLQRDLAAANELLETQLYKIRRLEQDKERLTRQLKAARETIADLVYSPGYERV